MVFGFQSGGTEPPLRRATRATFPSGGEVRHRVASPTIPVNPVPPEGLVKTVTTAVLRSSPLEGEVAPRSGDGGGAAMAPNKCGAMPW